MQRYIYYCKDSDYFWDSVLLVAKPNLVRLSHVNSSIAMVDCVELPELGTRQFCRDKVTMLSGHKFVCNCRFTIYIVATPSRH